MTIPRITIESAHWTEANNQLRAIGDYSVIMAINKAIEIALAEANAQQETQISAEEARKLGAGNAEWFGTFSSWIVCSEAFQYPTWSGTSKIKYRAIQPKAQPEPQRAACPQPPKKEPVDPHAALRAEYVRQRDAVPCELGFYLWEASALPNKWTDIGIPDWSLNLQYRCTDISCYVSKDGDGAIRMLRTEAQTLWDELGYTVEWFSGVKQTRFPADQILEFDDTKDGKHDSEPAIYTYKLKPAKVVAWADVPVGVRVIFYGASYLLVGASATKALLSSKNNLRVTKVDLEIAMGDREIELAPAADQPWIAVQDESEFYKTVEGLMYDWRGGCFKIVGLAEDYEMEKAK